PLTSGTVTFTEGGTPLGGPVPLAADGTATFSTHTLAAGSHGRTGPCSGAPDIARSTGTVDQVVNQATSTAPVASHPHAPTSSEARPEGSAPPSSRRAPPAP